MARVNGVNIPATEATAVIDSVAYQRWSRHRSGILRPIQLFLNWPWLMVVCKGGGAMSHGSRLILTQELPYLSEETSFETGKEAAAIGCVTVMKEFV
ncbi:hypothetical protein [Klebsiella pneumoniae]|uniref:hypothetical protein n=1 Tax=Klebsiella pneumoniae TaxID=573 RepID=UPI0036D2E8FD